MVELLPPRHIRETINCLEKPQNGLHLHKHEVEFKYGAPVYEEAIFLVMFVVFLLQKFTGRNKKRFNSNFGG